MNVDAQRYPIGRFEPLPELTAEKRASLIRQLEGLAAELRRLVVNLSPDQLGMSYRPGGWSVRQVVHHLADNDMNAVLRFKRALTEEEPSASSYDQDKWAELPDYRETPIETSLDLLESLHCRFQVLLRALDPAEFRRTLRTEALGLITLDTALQRFVWHDRHHLAQIEGLVRRI
ncbi:YfiT family bacillithiol transferase [Cohnella zeiphila]|uniref:Putative metal-dependent hydrolase n=1 Tax=Cohnella zeiphila TaxID=2761120 RepID=A0A7X0VWD7_9BACL|nr:putative metal-dependent hydrolase [Cohnella zeiphila]MBB6732385.1 putative metal-dependent hydrolase [Cohnella zeiphila]